MKRSGMRLTQSLMALMTVQVLLATLVLAAILLWSVDRGFQTYLTNRQQERLEAFALLAGRLWPDPGGQGETRIEMREILGALARQEGRPLERSLPPSRFPPSAMGPGDPPEPPSGRPRPPPRSGDPLVDNVGIVDVRGARIAGPPQPRARTLLRAPIVVEGRMVAFAVVPPPLPNAGLDARFLADQSRIILTTSAALALVSMLVGLAVARLWSRPLIALGAATRRIATGDFDVSLATGRGPVEIAALSEDVNAMALRLRTLHHSRKQWLAQISHELRTPVTTLRGELELLSDGTRRTDPAAIASLQEEVLTLSALIDDLHLLAVNDLKGLRFSFVELDARRVLDQAMRRFGDRATALGLDLSVRDPGGPVPVSWDPVRIDQVIANLLENSLKYTDRPGRIILSLMVLGDDAFIRVEDSPPGLDPTRPDLSDGGDGTDRFSGPASQGSGLGLAVARAIAEGHGGTVTFGPSELGGVQAQVRLPVRGAPQ